MKRVELGCDNKGMKSRVVGIIFPCLKYSENNICLKEAQRLGAQNREMPRLGRLG